MNWAAVYLVKQAALWSTARPQLNKLLSQNQMRQRGIFHVTPQSPDRAAQAYARQALKGSQYAATTRGGTDPRGNTQYLIASNSQDPRFAARPGLYSSTLSHELDEATAIQQQDKLGRRHYVLNAPGAPSSPQRISEVNSPYTSHGSMDVVLADQRRLASGELSPNETAYQLGNRNKPEWLALKRLGVAPNQAIPEGGRAHRRLLQRIEQRLPVRQTASGDTFRNLADLAPARPHPGTPPSSYYTRHMRRHPEHRPPGFNSPDFVGSVW